MTDLTEEDQESIGEALVPRSDTLRLILACFAYDSLADHDWVPKERVDLLLNEIRKTRFEATMVDLALSGNFQIGWDAEAESLSFTERTDDERERYLQTVADVEEGRDGGASQ